MTESETANRARDVKGSVPSHVVGSALPSDVMRVVLCPGQGAQAIGMGRVWAERSGAARAIFDRADALLGDRLGAPLSSICFNGLVRDGSERLNETDVSQPAIFVTSVACWHGLGCPGVSAAAGLSLGEYTALHLAGAFSFETGLELVTLRGRAMQDAADAIREPNGTPGSGMVAIIGGDEGQAEALCERARGSDVLVAANFNAPGQVVISGSISACRRAAELAGGMGLRAAMLPVAGAFHSSLMASAADRLRAALRSAEVRVPGVPVLSNVTGVAHEPSADAIRGRLVEQLTKPVCWEQNCRWLAATHGSGAEYVELAPGKTLAGLMRRIDKGVKVQSHDEPQPARSVDGSGDGRVAPAMVLGSSGAVHA